MNNTIIQNSVRFFVLILLQVLIFNNINLYEYINPYVYIVFVFFYPIQKEKGAFLFLSFLLGLCVDFFSNSGGINAAATLFIAFIRLPILSKILNKSDFDYQLFNIRSLAFGKSFTYIVLLTFIHHFILFSFEYFSMNAFGSIITKTLLSTIFTVSIIFIGIILFTKKR
ncbi:rod shape-determining protein MreD [Urechidicola croceus]|uniref:Rod shape-determining protein MreD n=1 Tax=Urechidicola croceus TaxID=1850246 RepID=A0A1D8PAS5_9FLAO|nr:rod shape-determining protein MreD [Urechidicola croceus]AOW21656.1 rod shape-determining protein MreD [Urechidicola croceus]